MQATYGIGGHGLLMAMSPACRVNATEDGDLVILRGEREVARISPGDVPAHAAAQWLTGSIAQFGEGGPTLELADGVELEALFAQIDTGMPSVVWSALAAGVLVELPVGVVLVPPGPDDDDPFFELHAPAGRDEFISFLPRPVAATDVVIKPAPYQQVLREGITEGRALKFVECTYAHAGKQWRQIFYTVPLDANEAVVVRAQACEPNVDALFRAAHAAAATLIPLG